MSIQKNNKQQPISYNSIDSNNQIPIVINNKKCKKYFMIDGTTKVYFNADFDSGNLQKVQQITPYIYKLYPGFDKTASSTQKTYFHFKVFGFQMCMVRFHITRVHILQKLLRTGQENTYKPIYRKSKGKYQKIQKGVNIYYNKQDQVQLSIDFQFNDQDDWTQFAFSYPYSYQDMINMVKQLKIKYQNHNEIYFHQEVLGYSQQGRKLQLLTITDRINCEKNRQQKVDDLFPQIQQQVQYGKKFINQGSLRPFKINKPKIIISGRVHPGESPSSYCVEGLIRFLLDQKDYRSYLLRKNFHFIIVPMLSLDGVYHGMFRSDLNGENLNRIYLNCSKIKHPTVWCFREYLKYIHASQQPVLFYFDFHAHPSKKQFFIYGNAFNQFTFQVQAETFGKLLQNNCPYFHNIDSVFSQKQMVSKQKNDDFTKEGCARVYAHRLFGIIHAYTVQCGYFAPGKLQKWQSPQTIQKQSQFINDNYAYVDTWQKSTSNTYTPQSYMLMGKSILVTILDLFHLNPFTRINLGQFKSIANIRKNVGVRIYNFVDRFRLIDSNVTKKMKILNLLLEQQYYKQKVGSFGLSISENYGMKKQKRTFLVVSKGYISKIKNKNKEKQYDTQQVKNQQNQEDFQQQIQTYKQLKQKQLKQKQVKQKQIKQKQIKQKQLKEKQLKSKQKKSKIKINQLKTQLLTQTSDFKQYKAQMQLKISTNSLQTQNNQNRSNINSEQKFQQKYYEDLSHNYLHVQKVSKQTPKNEVKQQQNKQEKQEKQEKQQDNNHKFIQLGNRFKNQNFSHYSLSQIKKMYESYRNLLQSSEQKNYDSSSNKEQKKLGNHYEENIQESLLLMKRKAISQKKFQRYRLQENSKKFQTSNKLNLNNITERKSPILSIKSQRGERSYDSEQNQIKQSRKYHDKHNKIQNFLRKQANKLKMNHKISNLQKFINLQTVQLQKNAHQNQYKSGIGKIQPQSTLTKFPMISSRNFGSLKAKNHG